MKQRNVLKPEGAAVGITYVDISEKCLNHSRSSWKSVQNLKLENLHNLENVGYQPAHRALELH